jgi:predicted N-acetyltransferase YhbS
MTVKIRQEKPADYKSVYDLIEIAFKNDEFSDHREQILVERLRKSKSFIKEFSIVAEIKGEIVGHILLTKIKIKGGTRQFDSLALAPVSVLPKFQMKGIGGMLINYAHRKAIALGYKSIIVLGHENYYPKFGYKRADLFDIQLPFEVPKENCMAIELVDKGLEGVSGIVEYPKEFME